MRKNPDNIPMVVKKYLPYLIIIFVILFFFWPVIVKNYSLFPGDYLISEINPYKSFSYLGYNSGGYPHKAQGFDIVRQVFPWKNFAISSLKNFSLPFWNPYNFSGTPQLAAVQSGVFSPLNLLFFIFNFNFAWNIYIILQSLLSFFFMYLYLRTVNVSKISSLFGAFSFTFSLYQIVWLGYGHIDQIVMYLPLSLYYTEKFLQQPKWKYLILISVIFAFSIFSGYLQLAGYLMGFVCLYFILRSISLKSENKLHFNHYLPFFMVFPLALILSAIQLIPFYELYKLSNRLPYSFSRFSDLLLPPQSLINLLFPDFFGNPVTRNYYLTGTYIERTLYIGILPLLFAFISLLKKNNLVKTFGLLSLVILLFNLNLPPILFIYHLFPSFILSSVPTRSLFLLAFTLSSLSALGFDYWQKNNSFKIKSIFLAFLILIILIWVFILVFPRFFPNPDLIKNLIITKKNLIFNSGIVFLTSLLIFYSQKISKKLILTIILCLTLADLYFYFQKLTPFSPKKFIYPQNEVTDYLKKISGINRYWGYGSAYISGNIDTYEHSYSPEGYDPLHLKRYGELLASSKNGQIPSFVPHSDANIAPGYGMDDLKNNKYRKKILDLLGVKYILHKNENLTQAWAPDEITFPPLAYKLIWQKGIWQIYENLSALPRVFLVNNYQIEKDSRKILNSIYADNFSPTKTVLLEENLQIDFSKKESPGKITLVSYNPNFIKIKTSTKDNKILFLSDNYYPGWQAFIDNKETKIYLADYTFRAVAVPSGSHEIVFRYNPYSFKTGAFISSLGVLFILSYFIRKLLIKT